ncbi:hypothetical protein [Microtetraspora malaysiensis]|uniref:hypothetical protein n=1 Tax=Microtetraspora malaysiensis TaxID=161358 RepID=UPI000A805179|nr:hypothetical protein [Microtetraspora malaysiensis]
MVRRPEVFVRPLTMEEGRKLQRITRSAKEPGQLHWIESEFAALRYHALNGADHRSRDEQNAAIGAYVRWRNARAQPMTNSAASSPIRS